MIHKFAFICFLTLGPVNAQMSGPKVGKVNLEKQASDSLKFRSASLVDTNPVKFYYYRILEFKGTSDLILAL